MSSKNEQSKFRWQIFVYTVWLVLLCKIIITGEYVNFLRPEFVVITILGGIALLVFLVSGLFSCNDHNHVKTGVLHAAIMLLPFFYFLNAQGVSLGEQAFDKRYSGLPLITNSSSDVDSVQSTETSVTLQNEKEADNGEFNDVEEVFTIPQYNLDVESDELTILDLYDMPDKFLGKQVAVIGMFHKDDEQISKDFGKNISVIYRFVIVCCAADALPAAILLDTQDSLKIDEGAWVKVKGIFSVVKKEDGEVPLILNPEIEITNMPEQQYMY